MIATYTKENSSRSLTPDLVDEVFQPSDEEVLGYESMDDDDLDDEEDDKGDYD